MANALRNLQLFRNGTPYVGTLAAAKQAVETAFAAGTLVLNDGEPISIRYQETAGGDVKGVYGVAYVHPSDSSKNTILWASSDINMLPTGNTNDYINITENPSGTFTVELAVVNTTVGAPSNGLASINYVAEYVAGHDKVVESGSVKYLIDDEQGRHPGQEGYVETEDPSGDPYLVLVLANAGGSKVYIAVSDMGGSTYTGGKDITINATAGNAIDVSLDEAIESSVAIGNIAIGDTIPAGASLSDILAQIFVKEYQAKANKPTNTISVNCNTEYSVGEYLGELSISRSFNGGSYGPGETDYTSAKFIEKNGANPLPANCTATGTTYKFDSSTITLTDGKYTYPNRLTEGEHTFSCTTTYDGSSVIPKTNLGNDSTATGIPIASGTTAANSKKFNVYYNVYVKIVDTLPADYSTILSETAPKHAITKNDVLADVVYEIPGYNKMIIMLPQAKTFYIKNEFNVDSESEYSLMTTVTDSTTDVIYNVYVKINDAGAIAKYQNLRFANA